MQLANDTVHHWWMKENQNHVIQVSSSSQFYCRLYGAAQLNTVHFGQCDLIFLLIPILYGVVCSDSVVIYEHFIYDRLSGVYHGYLQNPAPNPEQKHPSHNNIQRNLQCANCSYPELWQMRRKLTWMYRGWQIRMFWDIKPWFNRKLIKSATHYHLVFGLEMSHCLIIYTADCSRVDIHLEIVVLHWRKDLYGDYMDYDLWGLNQNPLHPCWCDIFPV